MTKKSFPHRSEKPGAGKVNTMRLQKYIADAGLASRREAEGWIESGRVLVNGRKVTRLGVKIDPEKDKVTVDRRPIRVPYGKVYYLFYKPRNVMVTRSDPEGRRTIYEYLEKIPVRLFPVGRLDFTSEGLLLLTNDGEFANRVAHPRYHAERVYRVKVAGIPSERQLETLRTGVLLDGSKTAVFSLKIWKRSEKNSWIRLSLYEGKNRQIRRMMEEVGLSVLKLVRVQMGPFTLGDLKPGQFVPLDSAIVQKIFSRNVIPAPRKSPGREPSHE